MVGERLDPSPKDRHQEDRAGEQQAKRPRLRNSVRTCWNHHSTIAEATTFRGMVEKMMVRLSRDPSMPNPTDSLSPVRQPAEGTLAVYPRRLPCLMKTQANGKAHIRRTQKDGGASCPAPISELFSHARLFPRPSRDSRSSIPNSISPMPRSVRRSAERRYCQSV